MRVMDYKAHIVLEQHDVIFHAAHQAQLYFGFHCVWGIRVFELEPHNMVLAFT